MRILCIGNLRQHTRTRQRVEVLRSLGHEVHAISTHYPFEQEHGLGDRLLWRLGRPRDRVGTNPRALELAAAVRPDVLWVEKATVLRPRTLSELRRRHPAMRAAFFSEDDMMLRSNRPLGFARMLPLYDVVFTTKSYNADPRELPAQGARRVVFVPKSFDPGLHRPVEVDPEEARRLGAPVTFIGTYERPRLLACAHLARNGIGVRVWGEGWGRLRGRVPGLRIEGRGIYGEEYVRALCASDVNLGFLRKKSRDLHTDRSVEIPACGAFLLAERTSEHLELFREGEEAAFFLDHGELLARARHYLERPDERARVAAAGRARCLASDYSHARVLERMLAELGPGECAQKESA